LKTCERSFIVDVPQPPPTATAAVHCYHRIIATAAAILCCRGLLPQDDELPSAVISTVDHPLGPLPLRSSGAHCTEEDLDHKNASTGTSLPQLYHKIAATMKRIATTGTSLPQQPSAAVPRSLRCGGGNRRRCLGIDAEDSFVATNRRSAMENIPLLRPIGGQNGELLPQDRSTGSYPALTVLTAHCAHTLTAHTARSLRCDPSGPAGGLVSLRKISTTGSLPQLPSRGRDMLTALTAPSNALTELRRIATKGLSLPQQLSAAVWSVRVCLERRRCCVGCC